MRILGLAFSGHGTSACLVEDGRVVRAVNLERLTRVKFSVATIPGHFASTAAVLSQHAHDPVPPIFDFYEVMPQMLRYLTGESTTAAAGIDLVVKVTDNISREGTDAESYQGFVDYWGKTRAYLELEHHLCHAYQAYLPSPFDSCAVLTSDGVGDALPRYDGAAISGSLGIGSGARVTVLSEIAFPNSLGGLYSLTTEHLGFQNEQEGNTMALASFGTDRFYSQAIDSVLFWDDGTFGFDGRAPGGVALFEKVEGFCAARRRGEPFTRDHEDLAHGVQHITEDVLLHMARGLAKRSDATKLAIAGGVALNCVANGRIPRETPFREIYVMPNAGDRGLAMGAALYGHHVILGRTERHAVGSDSLGRTYSESEVLAALRGARGISFRKSTDIASDCAGLIAGGRIIGWVQGGAEFGPRALGHRSILADPRVTASKERLDREIKKREWFRPYAPSVLLERASELFDIDVPSPYMLLAVNTRPEARERIPAVVHVDGSARVQTVDRNTEPLYHRLISRFADSTGIPAVLNTSFNGYGEPMVETPEDALNGLLTMNLDAVAIGEYLAYPEARPL